MSGNLTVIVNVRSRCMGATLHPLVVYDLLLLLRLLLALLLQMLPLSLLLGLARAALLAAGPLLLLQGPRVSTGPPRVHGTTLSLSSQYYILHQTCRY